MPDACNVLAMRHRKSCRCVRLLRHRLTATCDKIASFGRLNILWIPITYDGSGNHYCVDMDPAPDGTSGQIITMWHDGGERELMADSFTDWLTRLADEYERGEWVYSEDDWGVVRVEDVSE